MRPDPAAYPVADRVPAGSRGGAADWGRGRAMAEPMRSDSRWFKVSGHAEPEPVEQPDALQTRGKRRPAADP